METDQDLKLLSDCAAKARQYLELARKWLHEHGQTTETMSSDDDHLRLLEASAENLEPFVALFTAAADKSSDAKADQTAWSRIARGLAVTRESTDSEVAACAAMWQAFAWMKAGRPERARTVLPEVLYRPEVSTYGFLARLLKCSAIADAGQYAAATTLTIQLRQVSSTWFKAEGDNAIAARRKLAAVLQYRIGHDWLQRLREDKAAAEPLSASLIQLQQSEFGGDKSADSNKNVRIGPFLLETAIPMMAKPPRMVSTRPFAGTQEAGKP